MMIQFRIQSGIMESQSTTKKNSALAMMKEIYDVIAVKTVSIFSLYERLLGPRI